MTNTTLAPAQGGAATAAAAAHADGSPASKPAGKQPKKPPSLASAISGALSGSLISACVQPLDVLRTKMQADAARGVARGSLATARVVLAEQGVRGLWAGTGPSVIRVGLGAGLHFVLLEQMRALLSSPVDSSGASHLSNAGAAMAGGLSRAVAAVLLCPVTVVKTRMEYVADAAVRTGTAAAAAQAGSAAAATGGSAAAGAAAGAAAAAASAAAGAAPASAAAAAAAASGGFVPRYRDTGHALACIVRAEGVRGLFRGLVPTVLTNAPYSGLYYMMYMRLKEALSAEGRPPALVNFASGVAAAMAATLLTQPADVVRTRMQLNLAPAAAAAAGGGARAGMAAAAGAWATLFAAMRHEGPAALMTGAAPRFLKRTTQTALVWTLYEELVPRITALGGAAKAAWQQQQESRRAGG